MPEASIGQVETSAFAFAATGADEPGAEAGRKPLNAAELEKDGDPENRIGKRDLGPARTTPPASEAPMTDEQPAPVTLPPSV